MSTVPRSWAAMTDWALGTGSIRTCSPCRANSPRSCAMYSPARSTAGMAATVMSGSSGGPAAAARAAPPPAAHPAEMIMITAPASAASQDLRVFIRASVPSAPAIPGPECGRARSPRHGPAGKPPG